MKRKIFISLLLVVTVTIGLFALYIWNNSNNKNIITDEKELLIIDQLQVAPVDSFDLRSSDTVENVEIFQFTFSKKHEEYIGFIAFYHDDIDSRNYTKDNIIICDHNLMGTEKPFDLYTARFNIPSRFLSDANKNIEYQYYHGNINDRNISEIVFEFPNEHIHIKPVSGKFYTFGISNNDSLISIKGINDKFETLYEYPQ